MRKFYANYGPSLGRCCYTRSPFSSSLAAGVRLVVYITRCADCVYLNYLNIYPGYRLFFFALLFFQKRLDAMGDVSDRLWRLWCSGVLRIVYITRAQTTRTSQWVGLFRLNRFRRFKKKIIIFPWHFSESNVFWWHQERGWCCRQYLRCNLRFNRGEPTERVRVYTMWCRTRPLNDKKLLLLLLVIWLFWRGGWTRAQNGEKKGSAMAGWVLLLF